MSLPIRFFLLFLIVSLVPLSVAGFLTYRQAEATLTERIVSKLEAVVLVQEERVHELLDRYIEQSRQVTSRTQLRLSLKAFFETNDPSYLTFVTNIITDAREAVTTIEDISVIDMDGIVIASTDPPRVGRDESGATYFSQAHQTHHLVEIFKDQNNVLRTRLAGPFVLEGETIGIVEIISNASPIISVTEDYTGLGSTGEVVLAQKNKAGDAVFLTPLRFEAGAALTRAVPKTHTMVPMIPAVNGNELVLTDEKIIDYRGEPVFAVTRYIDALEWGMVAKIDQEEALAPVVALANHYFLVIYLAAFISVIFSLMFTRTLTEPIKELTKFAEKVRSGNFNSVVQIRDRKELGYLAETMNDMSAKLRELYRGLEEKVTERTTQLAEAYAKDKAILSSIGDGLVATDKEGRIVLVNKGFEKLLGWKESEVIGKKFAELVPMYSKENNEVAHRDRYITQTLENEHTETVTATNISYKKKDGSTLPVMITDSPIVIDDEFIGAVEIFRDRVQEEEIDKAKTEFVALASHQLRTPLSSIGWYAEMLIAGDVGDVTDDQKQYLQEIYENKQRMTKLITALLDVSRIELGTFELEMGEVRPRELLAQVLDELQLKITEKSLELKSAIDEEIHTMVSDQNQLSIIFQNIISNAIKYTPERGTVRVALAKQQQESMLPNDPMSQELLFEVTDTGYGIPKHQEAFVFNKLFRAENIISTDTEGTGLGLYIVKAMVEKLGGTIAFTSEQNEGTTFTVRIPYHHQDKKN